MSAIERDERRKLLSADYFSLMLFGLLNPVLKTMRGREAARALPRLKVKVCRHQVSLGSFSEMPHLVKPELVAGLLRSLVAEAGPSFWRERKPAPGNNGLNGRKGGACASTNNPRLWAVSPAPQELRKSSSPPLPNPTSSNSTDRY